MDPQILAARAATVVRLAQQIIADCEIDPFDPANVQNHAAGMRRAMQEFDAELPRAPILGSSSL